MFELSPKPSIPTALSAVLNVPLDLPRQLSGRYAELEDSDRALLEAERKLKAAHVDYARRQGPRPDGLYLEVVRLRQQSRRLLDDLADLFLGGGSRSAAASGCSPARLETAEPFQR